MARITVEDCIDKVEGPYDLVLIAKERTVQLNSGEKPNIAPGNNKNTVIALKEIAENKISVKDLQESAVNKLRKHIEPEEIVSDQEGSEGDNFENIYKGEVSKSGIPILPSKRARKIPEKIEVFKQPEQKNVQKGTPEEKNLSQDDDVLLEELKKQERIEEDSTKLENPETSDKS